MNDRMTRTSSWWPGIVLIAIGTLLLMGQGLSYSGDLFLAVLALFFLSSYAATRKYGFLVPGLILGGLAAGVALEQTDIEMHGGAVVLGLACAFLAIYVANVLLARPAQWWPLVPGTILATVGGSLVLGGTEAGVVAAQWWPLGLIVAGIVLILVRRGVPAVRA